MKKGCLSKRVISLVIMASVLSPNIVYAEEVIKKDQTVYINLSEQGKVENEIVSNWLHSNSKINNAEDVSTLKDITNVKGEEIPKAEGNKLIWNSDENNIFYQGKTNKKVPIKVNIIYYLNDKEIKPSDLAGKSGKFKIKINFKNLEEHKVKINGKDRKICTPFTVVTVLNLPIDKFKNVELSDGELVSDGNNQAITFASFPGLAESFEFEKYEDTKDINIPENLEITADVKDFEMGPIMMTATPELLTSDKVNKIKDNMGEKNSDTENKIQEKLDKFDEKSYLKDLVRKPNYVAGERQLIKDSFTVLGLDMSLLDFSQKYAIKSNIELGRKIKNDMNDIDYNYIMDDSTIRSITDYMTDENVDKARSIMDDTKKLQDIDMDRFDPMIDLLDDSDKLIQLKDYVKAINDNMEEDKLDPLLDLMDYKDKIKDLFRQMLGVKRVASSVVAPKVQTYIKNEKNILEPKIKKQVNDAKEARDGLKLAKGAVEKMGVVPKVAKSGVKKAVDAAIEQQKIDLENTAAKPSLSREEKETLLYIVDNAIAYKMATLPAAINSGDISKCKKEVKDIVDKVMSVKIPQLTNAIMAGKLSDSEIIEIDSMINLALSNPKITPEQQAALQYAKPKLEDGSYTKDPKAKAILVGVVSNSKNTLDIIISSGTIPAPLIPQIKAMVEGALSYEKQSLDNAISSGKLNGAQVSEVQDIIDKAMDAKKAELKAKINNGKLEGEDKATVIKILTAVINVYDDKLKEASQIMSALNAGGNLTKTQLQMIMPLIVQNNKTLMKNVDNSDLDDDSKKQIKAMYGLCDDLMSNDKVLDGIVDLQEMKLNADDILRHNDIGDIMKSVDYAQGLSTQLLGLKKYLDANEDLVDKAEDAFEDQDDIDYLKDTTDDLKDMKKDIDANKKNIDFINELLDKNDDPKYKGMKEKLEKLRDDLDEARPIIDSMQDEIDEKKLDPKFDDLPDMMTTLKNTKDDLQKNRHILELMQKALAQDNIDDANELLDSLEDFRDEYNDGVDAKDELIELADNYKTFTGIGENMDGKVKFVMKTDEIKVPEVKEVNKVVDNNKGGFIQWFKKLFHIK